MKKTRLTSQFIPVLTTDAGRCLTVNNWQAVGVTTVAYDLSSLLMKPGIELLSALPDLATYVGWHGALILNATMSNLDKEGRYTIRSEYDGSRSYYTLDNILTLIAQLKPHYVLLPEGVQQQNTAAWQSLPDNTLLFFAPADLPKYVSRPYGVYFVYNATMLFSSFVQQIQTYQGIPCYVGGELNLSMMKALADMGVQYLASDIPARDACHGIVYCHDGVISLKDDAYRMDFGVIDEKCKCPTCKLQLTRAYLHHLFEHTPLLCQRFLIQHNAYTSFTSASNTDIM